MAKSETRKCVIKVMVTTYEKARIVSNAAACGMTVSSYARTLLNGSIPLPQNNLDDMQKVFRLHADLGRMGGLMKMLLTNDERLNDMGREMATVTIDNILLDIRATQDLLKKEVIRSLGKRNPAPAPSGDSGDEAGHGDKAY
jgi:hypothetical protein